MQRIIAMLFCLFWVIYLKPDAQLVEGMGQVRDKFVAEKTMWGAGCRILDITEKGTKKKFTIPTTSIKFIERIKK